MFPTSKAISNQDPILLDTHPSPSLQVQPNQQHQVGLYQSLARGRNARSHSLLEQITSKLLGVWIHFPLSDMISYPAIMQDTIPCHSNVLHAINGKPPSENMIATLIRNTCLSRSTSALSRAVAGLRLEVEDTSREKMGVLDIC